MYILEEDEKIPQKLEVKKKTKEGILYVEYELQNKVSFLSIKKDLRENPSYNWRILMDEGREDGVWTEFVIVYVNENMIAVDITSKEEEFKESCCNITKEEFRRRMKKMGVEFFVYKIVKKEMKRSTNLKNSIKDAILKSREK